MGSFSPYFSGNAGDFTRGLEAVGNTAKLASFLFFNYLSGPCCGSDAAHALLMAGYSFLIRDRRVSSVVRTSWYVVVQKMLYRLVESWVLAAVLQSRVKFFRDAGKQHLLFSYVQEYFFEHNWVTRFFRAAGRLLLPQMLRNYFELPKLSHLHNPLDPLIDLPQGSEEALHFFRDIYKLNIPYAILTGGIVCDLTHIILEQMEWLAALSESRGRSTSHWRVLKPYICCTVSGAVESVILYSGRLAGALLGRAISRDDPLGAHIFWGERLAVLAVIPIVRFSTRMVYGFLAARLEEAHPATLEDECEDQRQQTAEEEATGTTERWDAPREDLYAILGVEEGASEAEIRRAYRKGALESHPDRVGADEKLQDAARERMVALNKAYETLSSETRRRRYDESRKDHVLVSSLRAFESLSTVKVVAAGIFGIVGLGLATGSFLYAQYVTAFYHLTTLGKGPLRFVMD